MHRNIFSSLWETEVTISNIILMHPRSKHKTLCKIKPASILNRKKKTWKIRVSQLQSFGALSKQNFLSISKYSPILYFNKLKWIGWKIYKKNLYNLIQYAEKYKLHSLLFNEKQNGMITNKFIFESFSGVIYREPSPC